MKKLSFLALAAVGLLFGACSSDKDVVEVNPNPETDEGSYIGISIALPSEAANATRANEDYDDGDDAEWEVKNATLYVFKGADEATATYQAYYTLGTDYNKDTGDDPTNVTATYKNATLISGELARDIASNLSDASVHYYAYVILNHNAQISPSPTKNSTTFAAFSTMEFGSIGADIAAKAKIYDGGLLMTNAPVANKAGGAGAPADDTKYTTLVELDKSKVYGSPAEAMSHPAACIYVERAAVKITVSQASSLSSPSIASAPVTFNGWQIINYEGTYYNNRQINQIQDGSKYTWNDGTNTYDFWSRLFTDQTMPTGYDNNLYRFVSYAKFDPQLPTGEGHTTAYRTYFAKDVNYSTGAVLQKPQADVAGPWIPMGDNGYTTENTFDVDHQTWKNTTMVTVKATRDGGDFYTIADGQDLYTSTTTLFTKISTTIFNDATVSPKITDLITKVSTVEGAGKVVTAELTTSFTTAPTASKVGVPITVTPVIKVDGTVKDITTYGSSTDETAAKTALTALQTAIDGVKGTYLPNYYKGGVIYYNARIQHFGEVETPWFANGSYVSNDGSNIDDIYGAHGSPAEKGLRDRRFLGRYGVVRDNWYKLEVESLNKIGTAEPINVSTTGPDTPDDQIENYISVHVHIVPWVVRTQKVKF